MILSVKEGCAVWFLLLLVGLLALVLYGHRNTYRFTLKRIHLP